METRLTLRPGCSFFRSLAWFPLSLSPVSSDPLSKAYLPSALLFHFIPYPLIPNYFFLLSFAFSPLAFLSLIFWSLMAYLLGYRAAEARWLLTLLFFFVCGIGRACAMGESVIWEWLIPEYPSTEGDEDAINKMGGDIEVWWGCDDGNAVRIIGR